MNIPNIPKFKYDSQTKLHDILVKGKLKYSPKISPEEAAFDIQTLLGITTNKAEIKLKPKLGKFSFTYCIARVEVQKVSKSSVPKKLNDNILNTSKLVLS